jgi:hypothetical protein
METPGRRAEREEAENGRPARASGSAYRVRIPGFVTAEKEVGLGDVIKRATSIVGIRPCGGCAQRAATLNRLLTFTRSPSRGAR